MKITAATDILYHATYLDRAVQIVEQQKFRLKHSTGVPSEEKIVPNVYYLSTARSITSGYFKPIVSPVIFQLNGKAISHNYKIMPVDFFSDSTETDELEDRIVSTKPTMSTKYVTAVHCPLRYKYQMQFIDVRYVANIMNPIVKNVQKLYRACKKAGIPIYFYPVSLITSIYPKYRVKYGLQKLFELPAKLPQTSMYDPYANRDYHPDVYRDRVAALVALTLGYPDKKLYKRIQPYFPMEGDDIYELFKYGPYSDMLAPVIAKMRKHRWTLEDLEYYLSSKYRYLSKGQTRTSYILDLPSVTFDFILNNPDKATKADMFLAKEYGIEPSVLKAIGER